MVKFHQLPVLGAVVVVVAVLTGCGGDSGASGDEAGSTESQTSSSGGSVIKTIKISETEFKLTPSAVTLAKPGTYEFRVVNNGSVMHALEVEGSGIEEESEDLSAGKSATFKVTFDEGGTYEMYCPIDGHRDQGMEGEITVGSAAGGGGGTTTDGTTTDDDTSTDDDGMGGY